MDVSKVHCVKEKLPVGMVQVF